MKLSVLIVTIDRLDELKRCVESLSCIDDLTDQIIIMENGPTRPWSDDFRIGLQNISSKIIITKHAIKISAAAARNRLSRLSNAPLLLFLDDDAYLLDDRAARHGVRLLENDPTIGATAFAQCDSQGELPIGFAQPAPGNEVRLTCGFAAYGAICRRELYSHLGGFREFLEIGGEENDLCRRIWAEGYSVVFAPDRSICHYPSEISRDMSLRAILTARNAVLDGLLNEMWYMLPLTIPLRMFRAIKFLRYARSWYQVSMRQILTRTGESLFKVLPEAMRLRKPIALKHHFKWEKLKRNHPLYNRH